jgi:hypothetical protein
LITTRTNGATVSLADGQILGNIAFAASSLPRDHLGCSLHEALDAFVAVGAPWD